MILLIPIAENFLIVSPLTSVSNELERLRRALVAVSEDLDAIEQRPHLSLRLAAEDLAGTASHGIESCVDHFALAMKRGHFSLRSPPLEIAGS
jgi:hypothetical protein